MIAEATVSIQTLERAVLVLQAEIDIRPSKSSNEDVSQLVHCLCLLQQGKLLVEATLEATEAMKSVSESTKQDIEGRLNVFTDKLKKLSSNDSQSLKIFRSILEDLSLSTSESDKKLSNLEEVKKTLQHIDEVKGSRISDLMSRLRSVDTSEHTPSSRAVLGISTPQPTDQQQRVLKLSSTKTPVGKTPGKKPSRSPVPLHSVTKAAPSKSPVVGGSTKASRVMKDITNTTTTPRAGTSVSKAPSSIARVTSYYSPIATPLAGSTPVRKQAAFIDAFLTYNGGSEEGAFFH
jgi:hypothetical protein